MKILLFVLLFVVVVPLLLFFLLNGDDYENNACEYDNEDYSRFNYCLLLFSFC